MKNGDHKICACIELAGKIRDIIGAIGLPHWGDGIKSVGEIILGLLKR